MNHLKLTLLFLTCFLIAPLFLTSNATAEEKPYGFGGCGLGSVIVGKDGPQVLAITTNGTGTQSFGITSGTSNCVDSGVVKRKREARAFIEINQRQLANDIAKGGGETVVSLAHIYNCSQKSEGAFGSALQNHYQTIFPEATTTPDHIEATIRAVIIVELTESCLS
jgi:hypothetical protein